MQQPTSTSRVYQAIQPRKSKNKKKDVSQIYGVKKESSCSKKGKLSHVVRRDTDTYDFPQFEQYKVDKSGVSKRKQTIEKKTPQPKPKTSRVGVQEKHKKSRIQVQLKGLKIKYRPKTGKKEVSKNKSVLQINTKQRFIEAVTKTFRFMDPLNTGCINEDNINKNVPEPALYFLGEVFLQVKQKKMSISQANFIHLCLPLMDNSSSASLQTFIENMQQYQPNKCRSARQLQPTASGREETPKRSSILKGSKQVQSGSIRKNHALDLVMQQIELSESKIHARMSELKDKKGSHLQLEHNVLQDSTNRPKKNQNLSQPSIKKVSFLTTSKEVDVTVTPIKNQIEAFDDSQAENKLQEFYTHSNGHNIIKSPTFQFANVACEVQSIPFSSNDSARQSTRKSILQTSAYGPTNREISQTHYGRSSQKNYEIKSSRFAGKEPLTSRSMHQGPSSCWREQRAGGTKDAYLQDSQRIDQLNSKLEQYIRSNVSKIERSKVFFNQNHILTTDHS